MPAPIGTILGASTKIAEYFGLINGVDTKITKLLHQAFNSAKANLEFARNTSGQNQTDYIKQARIEFNQAVSVEENENKVLALVGLSMCQYMLGDKYNACCTLDKIKSVELTKAELLKYGAKEMGKKGWPFFPVLTTIILMRNNPFEHRIKMFDEQKEKALKWNCKLIN